MSKQNITEEQKQMKTDKKIITHADIAEEVKRRTEHCTPKEQKSVQSLIDKHTVALTKTTEGDTEIVSMDTIVINMYEFKSELTRLLTDELKSMKIEECGDYCHECGGSFYNEALDNAIKTIERKLSL